MWWHKKSQAPAKGLQHEGHHVHGCGQCCLHTYSPSNGCPLRLEVHIP